jgi:hypothetical protein
MNKEKLRESLERLRLELNILKEENAAIKDHIHRLIVDIEHHIEHSNKKGQRTILLARIPKLIEQFETEHPRITNILNTIMMTLSDTGI